MKISQIMNKIEHRARENDKKVSIYEDQILNALAELKENSSRLEIYKTILKAVYKDGYVEKDEEDIVNFCRNLLKIKINEHQKVIAELKFI